jgi:hypothetical protein
VAHEDDEQRLLGEDPCLAHDCARHGGFVVLERRLEMGSQSLQGRAWKHPASLGRVEGRRERLEAWMAKRRRQCRAPYPAYTERRRADDVLSDVLDPRQPSRAVAMIHMGRQAWKVPTRCVPAQRPGLPQPAPVAGSMSTTVGKTLARHCLSTLFERGSATASAQTAPSHDKPRVHILASWHRCASCPVCRRVIDCVRRGRAIVP